MPTFELAILFYLFTAASESYAHQEECEPRLTEEAIRTVRGEHFEQDGLHIPMVKSTRSEQTVEVDDEYSARVMSPAGWTLANAQDLVFAMIRKAIPGAQPTLAQNELSTGRGLTKGELVNFDLVVTAKGTDRVTIDYSVTNGYDMPILKGQATVQVSAQLAR